MSRIRLPAETYDAVVEHAIADQPDECCGLLELDPSTGTVVASFPAENTAASPYRFELAPQEVLRLPAIEERGNTPVIYHSHTRSAPVPSQTDIQFAASWPGVPWLIVGTQADTPEVRCFEISAGEWREWAVERV